MCWNEAVCLHIKAFKPTLEKAGGKAEDVKNWCIGCWNSTHPTNLYDRSTFHAHKEGTTNTRPRGGNGVKVVREKKPKAPKVFCPKKKAKKSPAEKEEGDGGESAAMGEARVKNPCKRVKTREDGTTYECGTAAQKDGLCCKCFKELRPNEHHRKRCQHVEGETTCTKGGNYHGFCLSHLKHHYPECDVCKTHHPINEHTTVVAPAPIVPTNNRGCPDEVEDMEDDEEETPEEDDEEETPEEEDEEDDEEEDETVVVSSRPLPSGNVMMEMLRSRGFEVMELWPEVAPEPEVAPQPEPEVAPQPEPEVAPQPEPEVEHQPEPEVAPEEHQPQPEKKKRVLTEEQKERKNERERARRAAKRNTETL